jgi:hypothetical protein
MKDETQKGIVSGCQDLRKEGLVDGRIRRMKELLEDVRV